MNYLRILIFVLLVLLALLLPGLTLAMMLGWKPLLFGQTPDAAGASFGLIDRVATGAAVSFAYAWFLWPIDRRLWAHVALVFFAVEAILYMGGLVLGDSIRSAFVWRQFLIDAIYAGIGVLLIVARRSASPNTAR